MNKRQITLADLALELGISTATVSRALKDYPDISVKTKKRVLELAKRWNYRPNTMAAGLRKQESRIIGVIIPEIVNHFFSSVIKGIMQIAYESDYRVMLCQSDESHEKEVADANALFSSRVDGILVSLAHYTTDLDHFRTFLDTGIPLVFFDKVPPIGEFDKISRVVVNDFEGSYQMVSHLIEQGARRIAHYRGPLTAYTSRNRYEGYCKALRDHGIEIDSALILDCTRINMEEGRAFTRQLIEKQVPFDGIFCINDRVAIGAMDALKQHQINVPDQVLVSGFSDWSISAVIDPPLSSVSQPSIEMGKRAMHLLLEEIDAVKNKRPTEYQFIELETRVQKRKSTLRQAT